MTMPQPPEEVFCMTCGPDTVLERDPLTPVLNCPRCADSVPVPALPLFVVTGASGAGKTTVTEPLRRLLPDCEVFEADITLQVAAPGHCRSALAAIGFNTDVPKLADAVTAVGENEPIRIRFRHFRKPITH